MSSFDFKSIAQSIQQNVSKHSPEILTGIGIAGMITSTVLAVRATPKAIILLEERKKELEVEKLPGVEIVKTSWKCYIPSAVTCVLSTTCLIGASTVSARRNAALATAYSLTQSALKEYKEKVIEVIGEEKEKDIKDEIAKNCLEKEPVTTKEVIITGNGEQLCYDALSGRYFESDINSIEKAVNILNREMLTEMYVSLNDLYDELDLEHTSQGDELGWNIDQGLLEVDYSSQIAADGRPCIVINYMVSPKYNFYKLT